MDLKEPERKGLWSRCRARTDAQSVVRADGRGVDFGTRVPFFGVCVFGVFCFSCVYLFSFSFLFVLFCLGHVSAVCVFFKQTGVVGGLEDPLFSL